MINKQDIIEVLYNDASVGKLALNKQNLSVFEYDSNWIETGFSISPIYLPLEKKTFVAKKDPFDGLFGVFNDSLPDGWGRLLIDRYIRSKGFDAKALSILDRLSLVGKNGMGALSYLPCNKIDTKYDIDEIDYYAKEVEKIIESKNAHNLELLIAKAGSSAGVRPKVLINFNNDVWLVKFPAQYDDESIGEIEYNCSVLARKCMIEMTETRLFNNKYFGTKLFDRDKDQRFHVHSASGLLYASHRLPSLDYEDLIKLTHFLTKDFNEVEKMFNLMVFNIFIENRDDHARNFSYVYKANKWKLSHAYDLTPSYGFNGRHSTTVMGNGNPDKNDILKLAKHTGFPEDKAKIIIERNMDVIFSDKKNTKN